MIPKDFQLLVGKIFDMFDGPGFRHFKVQGWISEAEPPRVAIFIGAANDLEHTRNNGAAHLDTIHQFLKLVNILFSVSSSSLYVSLKTAVTSNPEL